LTPQDVAFDICLEKVDQYVNTLLPKENVIWISDTTGKQKRLKHGLLTYQIFETIKFGPDNKLSPHTARIVDTIYFGDSKESRFLQLADLCCATIKFHLMKQGYAEELYDLIHPQIASSGYWPEKN